MTSSPVVIEKNSEAIKTSAFGTLAWTTEMLTATKINIEANLML